MCSVVLMVVLCIIMIGMAIQNMLYMDFINVIAAEVEPKHKEESQGADDTVVTSLTEECFGNNEEVSTLDKPGT